MTDSNPRQRLSCIVVVALTALFIGDRVHLGDSQSQADAQEGLQLVQAPAVDTEIADPSWRLIHLIHPAHRNGIWHLAFSPDGKTIASAAADETTRIWDVKTGRLRQTIERPVNCRCVAYSPDGRTLAIAGGDHGEDPPGELVLCDPSDGMIKAVLLEHTTSKYVCSTAFSPDGRWLAAGGADRLVRVWDVKTRKLHRTLRGHAALVSSVAFSPDSSRLASASFDHTVRIWDSEDDEPEFLLEGHEADVRLVAFSPDGTRLLTTSEDKTALLWDTTHFKVLNVLDGHDGWVLSGAFSPDGSKVVTAGKGSGKGHIVLLRDAETGNWQDAGLFPALLSEISCVTFSPAGGMLAITGFDNFQIWKETRDAN